MPTSNLNYHLEADEKKKLKQIIQTPFERSILLR